MSSNTVPTPYAPPEFVVPERSPGGVGDQTGIRVRPVGAVEAEQRARRIGAAAMVDELEHRASVVCPALGCRAEEVPGGVGDQTRIRILPVGAIEAEQRDGCVGAAAMVDELEHRAIAIRPAVCCRAE